MRGCMHNDEVLGPLRFLLRPEFLASERARVAAFALRGAIKFLPVDTVTNIFKLLLSRSYQKSLKITALKEILRLLVVYPTKERLMLVERQCGRKKLHQDARVVTLETAFSIFHLRDRMPEYALPLAWRIFGAAMKMDVIASQPEVMVVLLTAKPFGAVSNIEDLYEQAHVNDGNPRVALSEIVRPAFLEHVHGVTEPPAVPADLCAHYMRSVLIPLCRLSGHQMVADAMKAVDAATSAAEARVAEQALKRAAIVCDVVNAARECLATWALSCPMVTSEACSTLAEFVFATNGESLFLADEAANKLNTEAWNMALSDLHALMVIQFDSKKINGGTAGNKVYVAMSEEDVDFQRKSAFRCWEAGVLKMIACILDQFGESRIGSLARDEVASLLRRLQILLSVNERIVEMPLLENEQIKTFVEAFDAVAVSTPLENNCLLLCARTVHRTCQNHNEWLQMAAPQVIERLVQRVAMRPSHFTMCARLCMDVFERGAIRTGSKLDSTALDVILLQRLFSGDVNVDAAVRSDENDGRDRYKELCAMMACHVAVNATGFWSDFPLGLLLSIVDVHLKILLRHGTSSDVDTLVGDLTMSKLADIIADLRIVRQHRRSRLSELVNALVDRALEGNVSAQMTSAYRDLLWSIACKQKDHLAVCFEPCMGRFVDAMVLKACEGDLEQNSPSRKEVMCMTGKISDSHLLRIVVWLCTALVRWQDVKVDIQNGTVSAFVEGIMAPLLLAAESNGEKESSLIAMQKTVALGLFVASPVLVMRCVPKATSRVFNALVETENLASQKGTSDEPVFSAEVVATALLVVHTYWMDIVAPATRGEWSTLASQKVAAAALKEIQVFVQQGVDTVLQKSAVGKVTVRSRFSDVFDSLLLDANRSESTLAEGMALIRDHMRADECAAFSRFMLSRCMSVNPSSSVGGTVLTIDQLSSVSRRIDRVSGFIQRWFVYSVKEFNKAHSDALHKSDSKSHMRRSFELDSMDAFEDSLGNALNEFFVSQSYSDPIMLEGVLKNSCVPIAATAPSVYSYMLRIVVSNDVDDAVVKRWYSSFVAPLLGSKLQFLPFSAAHEACNGALVASRRVLVDGCRLSEVDTVGNALAHRMFVARALREYPVAMLEVLTATDVCGVFDRAFSASDAQTVSSDYFAAFRAVITHETASSGSKASTPVQVTVTHHVLTRMASCLKNVKPVLARRTDVRAAMLYVDMGMRFLKDFSDLMPIFVGADGAAVKSLFSAFLGGVAVLHDEKRCSDVASGIRRVTATPIIRVIGDICTHVSPKWSSNGRVHDVIKDLVHMVCRDALAEQHGASGKEEARGMRMKLCRSLLYELVSNESACRLLVMSCYDIDGIASSDPVFDLYALMMCLVRKSVNVAGVSMSDCRTLPLIDKLASVVKTALCVSEIQRTARQKKGEVVHIGRLSHRALVFEAMNNASVMKVLQKILSTASGGDGESVSVRVALRHVGLAVWKMMPGLLWQSQLPTQLWVDFVFACHQDGMRVSTILGPASPFSETISVALTAHLSSSIAWLLAAVAGVTNVKVSGRCERRSVLADASPASALLKEFAGERPSKRRNKKKAHRWSEEKGKLSVDELPESDIDPTMTVLNFLRVLYLRGSKSMEDMKVAMSGLALSGLEAYGDSITEWSDEMMILVDELSEIAEEIKWHAAIVHIA